MGGYFIPPDLSAVANHGHGLRELPAEFTALLHLSLGCPGLGLLIVVPGRDFVTEAVNVVQGTRSWC